MKSAKFVTFTAMVVSVALFSMVGQASADTIAVWSFTASQPQSSAANTQAATGGLQVATASAHEIGMDNNYTYNGGELNPTQGSCDVVSTPGTAVPSFSEFTWRIRGQSNASGKPGNGWNTAAPQYTQGMQINASTAGETPSAVQFDWYCTTQGVRDLQVQYCLNTTLSDTSSTGWVNVGPQFIASSNDFYGASAGTPAVANVPVDVSLIGLPAGASNDPNFGIRAVSAYDTDPNFVTAYGATTYASAASTPSTPVLYNNSSGNWRFDNIAITGTAVPEPSTLALLVVGAAGLLACARRRR